MENWIFLSFLFGKTFFFFVEFNILIFKHVLFESGKLS